jgi:uncharacterized protein (TIGR03000 family)
MAMSFSTQLRSDSPTDRTRTPSTSTSVGRLAEGVTLNKGDKAMFQKALSYFGFFVVAAAAFLATAETGQEAAAFPRVGGRGGFHAGGFHGGGYRGGYYHGGYHHPYYVGGVYLYYSPFAYHGGSYPYYNPYDYWGWNYFPGYYGSYGTIAPWSYNAYTASYYGGTSNPYNVSSVGTTTAALPQISGNNAVVHVHVPLALAEVAFDGLRMTSTGKDRIFTTPELAPGKTYTYTVTANWADGGLPRSETRMVQVQAGQSATVDFSK